MKAWLTFGILLTYNIGFSSVFCVKQGKAGVGYTYRQDDFCWSIAGENNDPNILSELSWKDIRINQFDIFGIVETKNHLYFRANLDYGRIFHGKNQDSDYLQSHRKDEFSRVISHANKGEVFDLVFAAGYNVSFYSFSLNPLIGASWEEQHLRLFNGKRTIPFESKIENLHSSYKTRWYGVFLGFDSSYVVNCNFEVFGSFEYHFTQYRGRGHWNLRPDFLSDFKHYSSGQGLLAKGGLSYQCNLNWSSSFLFTYRNFSANKGAHIVTIDEEDIGPRKTTSRFNGASWRSYSFSLILSRNF